MEFLADVQPDFKLSRSRQIRSFISLALFLPGFFVNGYFLILVNGFQLGYLL